MCPMIDFVAASTKGASSVRPLPKVLFIPPTSMGSPREVPVPCTSTSDTSKAFTDASCSIQNSVNNNIDALLIIKTTRVASVA